MAGRSWAKRYAQAIYGMAAAQEPSRVDAALDRWTADLRVIGESLDNREFKAFLSHAKVPLKRKAAAIAEALGGVTPTARNLLSLMVSKGLVEQAGQVEDEYRRLLDRRRGIERVKVHSAIPLEEPERRGIVGFVERMTGGRVALDARVDPSILGGLVIQVGDKLMDGSAKSKLESLKEELETAPLR